MRTTRTLSAAVGTVIGATLLLGGLTGCTGGTAVPTFTPVSTAPSAEAPVTPGATPAAQDVQHGSGTGAGTGGGNSTGTGGGNGQGSGGGGSGPTQEEPSDPIVVVDPIDPGPSTPIDPGPGNAGPTIPIDPGPGDGKPKPVVRDHRGGDTDPSTASGGVVVKPTDPYAGATVRDHRK